MSKRIYLQVGRYYRLKNGDSGTIAYHTALHHATMMVTREGSRTISEKKSADGKNLHRQTVAFNSSYYKGGLSQLVICEDFEEVNS